MSSTPKPNPYKPHYPYKSIVASNAINQLTLNMRVMYNVRTPLPHERMSRIREATGNNEIAQSMHMFKFGYFPTIIYRSVTSKWVDDYSSFW